MGYCQFLSSLFDEGRVTVQHLVPLGEEELCVGDKLIAEFEQIYRLEMPADPPELNIGAARWAGTMFFRACQFAIYRNLNAEVLSKELDQPVDVAAHADTHYSVDLVFRFLPDLITFSGAAAQGDPLLTCLRRWARDWPLSSAGMRGIEDVIIDPIAENASLMQLYVDRVIGAGNISRLRDARVRTVVERAIGMFPEFAPSIRNALADFTDEELLHD